MDNKPAPTQRMTPIQVMSYFLELGFTSFGGPLAIIGKMQTDLVEQKKVLDKEEFLKALSLIKSLPGPVAPQMVVFCGRKLANAWIALVSVILFILPAFFMMLLLAMKYDQFRSSPILVRLMDGMQGGAFVLIAMAMHTMSKGNYRRLKFWLLFFGALLLVRLVGLPEPMVILICGFVSAIWPKRSSASTLHSFVIFELIWSCLKAGGLAFGTGLAILPVLQFDFVQVHQWVTRDQFLDALAFGQLTPGPISVVVTFVGYKVAGFWGAAVATGAIFFPGVFNMLTWFPRAYNWFSKQTWVVGFVLGATAAIVAGILLALRSLSESVPYGSLVLPGFLFLLSFKRAIPSWALILISGAGWLLIGQIG